MPALYLRVPPMPALALFALLALLQSMLWIGLAVYLGSQCSWMALLMAVTAVLSLRLGRMARGRFRALWAAVLTLLGLAWASWGILVVQMGASMGVPPQESAVKLGLHLAITLWRLANTPLDYVLMALAVIVATIAAR